MIAEILFSVNLLISLGKPDYNLSYKELRKEIEIKKERFLNNFKFLKNNIKIKKTLILSQKILIEIPDSLLNYFKINSIPYTPDYLLPVPKLMFSGFDRSFWHKKFIKADTFYKIGIKGKGNVAVIIDTGIDTTHPDLKGKIIIFKDFVNYGPPSDPLGHGTFVASLIAGDSAGIAPLTKLIVLKVFSEFGGLISDIHEAFDYVAELIENGINVKILNGSFGTHPLFDEFFPDLFYLKNKGVFLCFAAGNEGPSSGTTSSPSNYPFVFSSGACDSNSNVTNFSSRGPSPFSYPWSDTIYYFFKDWNFTSPFLIAPGKDIKGAFPLNQYIIADGTSASSPILAGSISLILQYSPFLTPDSLAKIFKNNLRRKPFINYPNYEEGFGFLDLKKIIKVLERKDTLLYSIQNFSLNSKNFPLFQNDTFIINVSLISNKFFSDSIKIKLLNKPYYILLDTIFKFYSQDILNFSSRGVLLNYPDNDTLKFNFLLTFSNFSKTYEMKVFLSDSLLTIKNKNYEFSISSTGSIGFLSSEQKKGKGFIFKNYGNLLYYGSLAFGNSFNYIVDRFYEKFNLDDRDTRPLKENKFYFKKENNFYTFKFRDDYSQHPKGNILKVKLKDFDEGFLFILKPENFFEEMHLASFFDPDILNPLTNFADYDSASRIIFTSKQGGPVFGILDIDNFTLCGVIKNEIYAYSYGGLPDSLQYLFMKGDIRDFSKDLGDYSIYISKKVNPLDSLLFFIFAGENFDTLLSKRERILNKLNLIQRNNFRGISRIYPNPFIDPYQKDLKIINYGKGKITFYDLTGRKTYETQILKDGLNVIKLNNFKNSGIYFLKFNDKNKIYKLVYLNLR